MKVLQLMLKNPAVAAGAVVAVIAAVWIAGRGFKGIGQDIGSAAGDVAVGAMNGAVDMTGQVLSSVITAAPEIAGQTASNVADWSNSAENPLQPFGAWLGGKLYDITHP